jgi:hypothetical protein
MLPGNVEFICGKPTQEAWDRYLDKSSKGNRAAGQRELLYGCAKSHDSDQTEKILLRFPAVANAICIELDGMCGSDHEFKSNFDDFTFSTVVDGEDLVFDAPTGAQYETLYVNFEDDRLGNSAVLRDLLRDKCRDKDLFDRVIRKYPTITGPAMPQITEVCGGNLKVERKKG